MNSIFYKLGGSIMALFLIVLLPLGFVIEQVFTNFNHAHLQDETEEMASQYAMLLAIIDDEGINLLMESMSSETAMEVVVLDQSREIVGNSGINGFMQGGERANKGETGSFTDQKDGQEYFYSGKIVQNSSTDVEEIYIFSPSDLMGESAFQVQNALILSGTGALLLAFGFTFMVSKRLSSPLQAMEKAAYKMAKGDLEVQIPVSSKDELGSLSHSMNKLSRELKRYRVNRQEFFSNVSHEFRTPLSYLQGYSHALKSKLYRSEEEKQQFIEIIYDESHRMNRLIHDLFELSRMEEKRFPLELQLVQIKKAAHGAVEKVEVEAKKKGISIVVKVEEEIPNIVADSFRLEQIFINLLHNAVRYTEQGQILVKVTMENGNVKASVSDTGIGIATEELPYIFERFYRVEKSRARDFGGTGLGLAIVKQLTELQYGRIKVESHPDIGTIFTLSFPVAKEEEE